MNKRGAIVVIDDDLDDHEIIQEIFKELNLPNEIKYFGAVQSALDYLSLHQTEPFIIISDLHLQEINGFQLLDKIRNNDEISRKCIPLIFVTTGTTKENLARAYRLSVQGIFYKPPQYEKWKSLLKDIYDYWQDAITP
ncbi:response regulator [Flavitalea sp.]|nr:response regulator [Flavitalea sp.]